MPLYQRRKRRAEKAEKLARGEAVPFASSFSKEARTRILWAMKQCLPSHFGSDSTIGYYQKSPWENVARPLQQILLAEWGRRTLAEMSSADTDVEWFITEHATSEQMLDVIEAWFLSVERLTDRTYAGTARISDKAKEVFSLVVNDVLDDEDMAYQVVGERIVERSSMVMHAEVIEPTLSLLHGRRDLADVEKAFQNALDEMKPDGDASDAITDAATALQVMLQICGAEGNSLGPLITSAKKRGVLGPYDSKLSKGIELIAEWISADRSTRGDAHKVGRALKADAWLAIHVAGALILRLEKELPR